MYDLIIELINAINAGDKKRSAQVVRYLNKCGCDNYTIYVLLNSKEFKHLIKQPATIIKHL